MTQSITLTASMRANLASLKGIQNQMDTTQTRLSTGKKVNSAIDNASSFYQSRALTNRAADLDSLLDSMGQGIQTIQAANQGIESITAFIDQAKSVATSAFSLDATASDYETQVANYQKQFNDIREEINKLAKDSSYQGVNLLTGSKLTVMFNETRTHFLDVQGKNIYNEMADASVGFGDAAWVDTDNVDTLKAAVTTAKTAITNAGETVPTDINADVNSKNSAVADLLGTAVSVASTSALDTLIGTTNTKVYSRVDNGDGTYTYSSAPVTTGSYDANATYFVINGEGADDTAKAADLVDKVAAANDKIASYKRAADYKTATDTLNTEINTSIAGRIDDSLNGIAKAVDYLRDYSSELGNNFSIIETRENFTEALVDVLETGSDNLVLADMNEESANYLALQTRQQLAINSLALASQSAQSVLKLF